MSLSLSVCVCVVDNMNLCYWRRLIWTTITASIWAIQNSRIYYRTHKHMYIYVRYGGLIIIVIVRLTLLWISVIAKRFSSSWFKRITTQSFDCWSLIFWFVFLFRSFGRALYALYFFLGPFNFYIVCFFFSSSIFFVCCFCWFVTHRGSLFWEYGVL